MESNMSSNGSTALGSLDLIFMIGSVAISVIIGFYFTNKNNSIDSYMFGDRKMSVIPVAISLMTSCLSGLSLLGSSSELFYQGPTYAFVALSIILCGPITAYTVLPVFYRMNELSLYKYLHERFSVSIKYIVTTVFILQMIFYNSVVLYLPAMVIQSIMGISKGYSILLIGIMCVIYSGIGGLKAVVWTDFFQALSMYISLIVIGAYGTYDAGGFANVFMTAKQGGRLDLTGFFDIDLTTRHTFFGIIFGSTIKHIYLVGVNQVQIQRAVSLPTLKQGQWAFMYCSIFAALISLLSTYMGFVLYAAYHSCDPYLNGEIPRRDAIIIHYVANRFAEVPGIRGIFVAGIFSATLSTLSSFANSMAALAIEDFIKPALNYLKLKQPNETTLTWLAKALATLFGLICVLMAYVIDKSDSRFLQSTTTMFGAIGVPFLAAFAMGIFTRFANTLGIFVSLIVTVSIGAYITIYQVFFGKPLEPIMPTEYNEQCAKVFNMSSGPLEPESTFFDTIDLVILPQVKPPFSIERISYMTLPAIQFILTIFIATIVSLMTGGWKQQVDDKYLVKWMHSKGASDFSRGSDTSISITSNNHNDHQTAEMDHNLTSTFHSFELDKQMNNCHPKHEIVGKDCKRKRKLGVINITSSVKSSGIG